MAEVCVFEKPNTGHLGKLAGKLAERARYTDTWSDEIQRSQGLKRRKN